MDSRDKRIALVTGANKGIGFEIARQLGQAGVTVLLAARDSVLGQAAVSMLRTEGLDVHSIQLNVTDPNTVENAAQWIRARHERLDILVNNAGIGDGADGPPSIGSVEAARKMLETNFLGVLTVTQSMLPLLRKASSASIVNMSSSLGSLGGNADPKSTYYGARLTGYNASKAALNMLTVQLAQELRDTQIIVNSVCPGFVKTDLNGNTGHLSATEAAALPVRLALLRHDRFTGRFMSTEGEVAW